MFIKPWINLLNWYMNWQERVTSIGLSDINNAAFLVHSKIFRMNDIEKSELMYMGVVEVLSVLLDEEAYALFCTEMTRLGKK